jgi:hypothetical protein
VVIRKLFTITRQALTGHFVFSFTACRYSLHWNEFMLVLQLLQSAQLVLAWVCPSGSVCFVPFGVKL